ncbi:hypothetical protein ACFVUW_16330 [Streptomyces xiamenensis]|uniref:hypothetical protein n=1 Tax=Streptomyces xiamenensis TaxID=408015 RepID=UPI0036E34CD2
MTQDLWSMSHAELVALLNSASPDALIQRGDVLEEVARAVAHVGTAVARETRQLEWEGQTANTLREWVARFEQESEDLKVYADRVATSIKQAGAALREAKSSMPPVPDTILTTSREIADQESFRVGNAPTFMEAEELRSEAAGVISRLGSVYAWEATVIQTAPEPTFTPLEWGGGPGIWDPSRSVSGGTPGEVQEPFPVGGRVDPRQDRPGYTAPSAIDPSAVAGTESVPGIGEKAGVGTSLDSVGTVPNGSAPPVAPSAPPVSVVERPVGGGPPQQPVVGPVPGWPSPGQPGQGPGRGGGQVPPVRGLGVRPGEVPPVRPSGPPSGPGSQPPVGRPAGPGMPGGQQPAVGRPPMSGGGTGSGPGGGNPWGKANNYGLLGGKPVPNAKPTVASRIPPGGVIQPGMNAANSRLTPTRNDQPATPRPTYGKATVDGRPATGRGERGRSLPKPTGVIGLPGQGRKNSKKKKKKNESKDDEQQP